MRKKSGSTSAKSKGGKKIAITTPPSVDPLAFLSGSGSKKGKRSLSPPVPISVTASPVSPPKSVSTVADLRNLVASQTESLKRHLEMYHNDIINEFDSSQSRISKRFKIQTQACQQVTDDIDKEYKKMSDRILENTELIRSSYTEFIAETQSSAARFCKVAVSELAQSTEKTINDLRARFKIPNASV